MPDFAPNFTARYVVRYSTLGLEHSMQFRIARLAGSVGLTNMTAKVGGFLAALQPLMFADFAILGAKYSQEDTAFFVPATVPSSPTGAIPVPAQPKSQSIMATSFVGLSSQGQKARGYVYGLNIGPENVALASFDDFRITGSETADIAAAIAILNNGSPNIVASDNNTVLWYSYVNMKYNDFHLRSIRA